MLGMRGTDVRTLAEVGSTSGTVTDATVYSDSFYNDGFRAMRITVVRASETGTATLAVAVEFQEPSNQTWYSLLDHAGNAISFVTFADGATGIRYIDLVSATALPGPDTDGVLVYGTNYKVYEVIIPFTMRLAYTHGGTSISNTYSASVQGFI